MSASEVVLPTVTVSGDSASVTMALKGGKNNNHMLDHDEGVTERF